MASKPTRPGRFRHLLQITEWTSLARKGKIYIIPTKFGALYLGGTLVMLLIGSAYGNNLVLLLCFFMLSLVLVAMVETNNNLRGLLVTQVASEPGPANGSFNLTSVISSEARQTRRQIRAEPLGYDVVQRYDEDINVPIGESGRFHCSVRAPARGVHPIAFIRLSSTYPLGLFYAWQIWPASGEAVIYPAPNGSQTLPPSDFSGEAQEGGSSPDATDDFHGHRSYQPGESQRRIDWKAHSRGRPLLIKDFRGGLGVSLSLDWRAVQGRDFESRLSQLAHWVLECKRQKLPFRMRAFGQVTPVSLSRPHVERCLRILASAGDTHERTG
jgi:uncharacterized protein (DUF58 family)